jgi:aerobic-type carbon monoxide dehydrogenase small subunit (CoxS/CutS family)
VQQAFLDEGAMQCGYCVPGMIMAAVGLLDSNPNPSDSQIVQEMSGNICRCGGYPRMVAAIRRASHAMRGVK